MVETDASNLGHLVRDGEVHRDLFVDQDVFNQEMASLFANCWIYVGHDSQIPKRGSYYATTIGSQPVIMVRHKDGSVRVIYNRCPHRGVQLVSEGHGDTGPMFRCPYHAWTFNTDGSLFGIPVKEGYKESGFDQSCASHGVESVTSHVYRGFVFARLSRDGIGFEEYFGESLSTIDNMVDRSPEGRLEVAGAPLRYLHYCNWKMLVDNQTDTFHPMIAHESSAGTVRKIWEESGAQGPKPMVVEVVLPFTAKHDFYVEMGIRTWPNGHGHTGTNYSIHSDYTLPKEYTDAMDAAYGPERAAAILREARHNTVYFPNMTMKGAIQTLRLFKPLGPDKTLVESWVFRLVGAPDELLERSALYNRLINSPTSIVGHDDLEMYERAQQGLKVSATPWINYQREYRAGERYDSAQLWSGQSEVQMRNQFNAWVKFMKPVSTGEAKA